MMKISWPIKGQGGFSLIEILISLSLTLVVLSIAYSIYFFGVEGYLNNTTSIENQSNVRIAMDHISYHARRSKDVSILGDNLVIGNEFYKLRDDFVLMNKDNQLSMGISDFTFEILNPNILSVTISSIPNRKGQMFTLETYFYLMDIDNE